MDHYDVIIIGTGAGGGTLAPKLAPSGKRTSTNAISSTRASAYRHWPSTSSTPAAVWRSITASGQPGEAPAAPECPPRSRSGCG